MTTPDVALLVPKFSRYGGTERFCWELSRLLAEGGLSPLVVCGRAETDPAPGVEVLSVGRPGGPKWAKTAWFARRAPGAAREARAGLVVSLGKTWDQDLVRVGGAPMRSFWRMSKNAWPDGFPRTFKMLRRRLSPANRLAMAVEARQFSGASEVVAVSHMVRDMLLADHPGLDPDRVRVIYNRPDLERFSPPEPEEKARLRREKGFGPEDVLVGTAAANFILKGTATLVRALEYLPTEYHLLVAGGRGSSGLERLAASLGAARRVHFLGRVERMEEFYKALDLFALPTWFDACSNAVLEAMAAGLPTVSTASNGSSFFLPENRVLQDPGDARAMAGMLLSAREGGRGEPFTWPQGVDCGLDAWVELVRARLGG